MGPLAGLRVIELASIGPGPMCAMLLADQGAQVVRVDRLEPSGLGVPVDTRFDVTGRGRQSVAIDLRHAEGRDAALRLIDQADVLIEGWRPGVAERLGLGPEACHARNPALVYGRMTGFGQSGPLAAAAGHDLNYIALTGALQAIGPAGQSLPPLNLVGDYGGGALYLAFGLMAALYERHSSGRGQVVDAAMVDGASSLLSIFHGLAAAGQWDTQQRQANLLDGGAPFYACYDTADGLQVSLAALEPKFFAEFVRLSGLDPAWVPRQYDRRHWPALREAIATLLRSRPRAEWCALLEGTDACFAPVLTLQQAAQHPHAAARGGFIDIGGVPQPAPAPRFSRSQAAPPGPPVAPGADTGRVLAAAGFAPHEIEALRRSGAIAGACA